MKTRKEMKRLGRAALKRHYVIFVVACLMAAFLSAEFTGSLLFFRAQTYGAEEWSADGEGVYTGKTNMSSISWQHVFRVIAQEDMAAGQELTDEVRENAIEQAEGGNPAFGRSRGVLSGIVNQITSGSILVTVVTAAASITGSESSGLMVCIVVGALGMGLFWALVQNTFPVVIRRVFLEGMNYQRVTSQRFVFLLRVRKWLRASWIMLVKYILYALWCLTLVGAVVKRYSYFLVPYIVAENPGMTARQAITLSRRMMKGHKWECFVFELSFVGWQLLGLLTMGLSNIFYTNPYKVATMTQYYGAVRAQAVERQIPGWELLHDTYLYEKADGELIAQRYADVIRIMEEPREEDARLSGWRGFLANNFGVLLLRREQDRALEKSRADYVSVHSLVDDVEGEAYPVRLYPTPEEERRKLVQSLNYMRHYSVWSLVIIFLSMSVFGWLWEVGLHLVAYGQFVNRGVLHGPWLPIYGTGSVLMLTLLYRLRKNMVLEFVVTVAMCGFLEYMTAWVLELVTGGVKWWDYSGYFLNVHGRICAEGLLVFGIGGLAIVYVIAPVIDNLVSRFPEKKVIAVCVIFMAIFGVDMVYSQIHPNMGSGITDIGNTAAVEAQYSEETTALERESLCSEKSN